ncbi:MAG: head GIN domain-containing protein [Sediminibacterium sp.]
MKKLLIALLFIMSAQLNAQQKTALIYDNNAVVRKVSNFNAIKVSSAIDLYLTQSSSNKVAVSASNDEVIDQIITEVEGGVLNISLRKNDSWLNWKKWGNYKIKAYVSIKDINAITALGASDVHIINTLETPKIKIKLSGASDLSGEINAQTIIYDLSGASNCNNQVVANAIAIKGEGATKIELSGNVDDLSVIVSGASNAKLYDLYSKAATLQATGASNIQASVAEILKANAAGASNINYKGSPNVNEHNSSGASTIKHKKE